MQKISTRDQLELEYKKQGKYLDDHVRFLQGLAPIFMALGVRPGVYREFELRQDAVLPRKRQWYESLEPDWQAVTNEVVSLVGE